MEEAFDEASRCKQEDGQYMLLRNTYHRQTFWSEVFHPRILTVLNPPFFHSSKLKMSISAEHPFIISKKECAEAGIITSQNVIY
ncbi:hypothetical protein CEXT_135121 [Caerostris extrusa]|uniref:Uncharacterized protein n=1 Tax=Caerostris extrusa TaxID=172846 RepID=A0AAV4UL23_CAEEX|nr:hypothetical protein CEXT_135121 [Caerostris extrusa]